MPIIEVPAQPGTSSELFAVLLSGDGETTGKGPVEGDSSNQVRGLTGQQVALQTLLVAERAQHIEVVTDSVFVVGR